jgi:prepilin-type N-terminal cleavage/methylation domain-containing protein
MLTMSSTYRHKGFTIVELLIVIVVIAILAAISVVAYNGFQQRAIATILQQDLRSVSTTLELARAADGAFPASIPASAKTSPGVTITASSDNKYTNLTEVQKGVLFHQICAAMINEGLGSGQNNGGSTENWITNCNVNGAQAFQIVGWSTKDVNPSIASTTLATIASSIQYNDSYRPNRDTVERNFFNTLHTRYLAEGGTYPVTTFWDSWASSSSGVQRQELPSKSSAGGGWLTTTSYCAQATHEKFTGRIYSIQNSKTPTEGVCPTGP